jgi:hypothetical protein
MEKTDSLIETIKSEISEDPFYQQNFSNEGQKFVAWYLRRVLLRPPSAIKFELTDSPNDKKIDAIVIDDDNRQVFVIQGKYLSGASVGPDGISEILAAWSLLRKPTSIQSSGNRKLTERIEAFRKAIEDEYDVEFRFITTTSFSDSAISSAKTFQEQFENDSELTASLLLVDLILLESQFEEANVKDLPSLNHDLSLDVHKVLITEGSGIKAVLAIVPLSECIKLPGIVDGRLFRKNVRQFLGTTNKVNKGLKSTLNGDRPSDFFFYHNGITAICRKININSLENGKTKLHFEDLSVVNGCQSLATIYQSSDRIRSLNNNMPSMLFRFYEIPQRELADRISIYTNTQSAVKPRDLKSTDKAILNLKRSFENRFQDGFFINQRGLERPSDKDTEKTVDGVDLGKSIMAWHCQRPNVSYNERKLFDDYFRTIFRPEYDPQSMLALQRWLNIINENWKNLGLNETLEAVRSYARFHMIFIVSMMIANASDQGDKIPFPSKTLQILQNYKNETLSTAATCFNQAFKNAHEQAELSSKVFSPQNWLKSKASVQSENLVTVTVVSTLKSVSMSKDFLNALKLSPENFGLRWTAEGL